MLGRRAHLFRVSGVSVGADVTSLLVLLLVAATLAMRPTFLPQATDAVRWVAALAGALGLLASIVFHELGHAIAAQAVGVRVSRITLFLFGGVAELDSEPIHPWRDAATTIAGPLSTGVLALLLLLLARSAAAWPGGAGAAAFTVLQYLLSINLLIALFNLLPAFPLDGGRLLRALLWRVRGDYRWATRIAAWVGTGLALALIALGVGSALFDRLRFGGLWSVLLGMFLLRAALQTARAYAPTPAADGVDGPHPAQRPPAGDGSQVDRRR